MFHDRDPVTGADVSSSWKMSVSVSESSCQTMPSTTAEVSCQAREAASSETQTDAVSSGHQKTVDEAALAKFVSEAAIMIEDELESIALSRAFDMFNGYGLDDETEDKEVTLVRHLDTEEGWRVGGLAWNSMDSRLVISTVEEHSDWCDHTAKILVYSVDRSSGDLRSEQPGLSLSTQSCVTVTSHSRHDSGLLAAGSYTGEVTIYRTDREAGAEAELMTSGTEGDTDTHNPVVSILWLSRNSLVSVHSSGVIRLFTLDTRKNLLILKKCYLVTATHLPRSLKPLRSGEVGIVDAEVSEDDPSNVILSTEAGCVIMTDLNSELTVASPQSPEVSFYDPVMTVASLHTGAVTSMALSPYDDNILATAGEDLRLVLVAVTSPHSPASTYQLERPVSALSWSPTRPSLLAAASNRFVFLFDTIQASSGPVLRIRHTERNISLPITGCSFPNKDGSRIVSSDKFGRIYFWRLPQYLNTATIQEKNRFQNIPYQSE